MSMQNKPSDRFVANLDWNLLRTFAAIVEEGSVTRAAHRLLRRQPAVSQALQRLEAEIGSRLIDRGHGIFRLTAEGRNLYRECQGIYESVSRLKEITHAARQEISGEVTIMLASHVITPLLDTLLTENSQAHPKVTYVIKTASSANVAIEVQEKTASFGICLVNRRLPDLNYDVMYREFFGFYCGPPHPLFGANNLKLRDLRDLNAVSFDTDDLSDALRPVALLRRQHELEQRIVGQSSQLEEVRRMIQCGIGIGPLPVHVAKRDVDAGLLWRLPPYKAPPAVDIFLVVNPRKRFNRAESLFIEAMRDRIRSTPIKQRTYV